MNEGIGGTLLRGIVLVCGTNVPPRGVRADARVVRVPARPGKADVDALLAQVAGAPPASAPGADVVVVGTDADLAAVALRLLRADLLASTSVGYVPAERRSACAALWGVPTDPVRALEVARTGVVHAVPLIRDDTGGVLLARGTLVRVDGVAYCDDEVALRGTARSIEVRPDLAGGAGLEVLVRRGALRRASTLRGRAFQLGCAPTVPVVDGVRRARPVQRWTWYRHTEDLRVVR